MNHVTVLDQTHRRLFLCVKTTFANIITNKYQDISRSSRFLY